MKTLITLLASAGVGFGAAYLYVSNQKDDQFKKYRTDLEDKASAWREEAEKELDLLKSVRVTDERLAGVVERTTQNLLDGKPVENAFGGSGGPGEPGVGRRGN